MDLKIKFTKIVKEIVGKDKFNKLTNICCDFKVGQPDLFIYNLNSGDYFFAECKSERDQLRSHQKDLISLIKKIVPVKIIHLSKT